MALPSKETNTQRHGISYLNKDRFYGDMSQSQEGEETEEDELQEVVKSLRGVWVDVNRLKSLLYFVVAVQGATLFLISPLFSDPQNQLFLSVGGFVLVVLGFGGGVYVVRSLNTVRDEDTMELKEMAEVWREED